MPDIKTPGAIYTPFEPGIIARVAMGLRYLFTGQPAARFFGPGEPMQPVAPEEVRGREFDYQFANNLVPTVRNGEIISMDQLRQLAESWDLLRTILESCKDQMARLKWTFQGPDGQEDQESIEFFNRPSPQYNWDEWLRVLLEDMFVLDAPALYVNKSVGGQVLSFDPIDGGTIKPLIDPWGRRPMEGPAYQQILKGLPAVEYTRDQLIYSPRNPRSWKIYGYGPVEQIIVTINIALRRQEFQLGWYKNGSAPSMIYQAPEGFTFAQIKEFRTYLMDLLSGNSITRNQGLVIPNGMTPVDTKAMILKDEYDEWLARLACYAFSISPQPFTKDQNRATGQIAQTVATAEGIAPRMLWVERLVNDCQARRGKTSKFSWVIEGKTLSAKEQAEVDQIYVNASILTINEVRERMGLEAVDEPEPVVVPPPPPEKVSKAKRLPAIRRDRPALLLKEARYQAALSKSLYRIGRSLAPKLAEAFGLATKADNDLDAKIRALVEAEDWASLEALMAKHGQGIYSGGVSSAAAQMKATDAMLSLANESAIKWAAENAGKKITEITTATMDSIRATVVQSQEEGWSSKRLADEIQDDWAFSTARAETIARTEGAFSDVQGNIALYKESGLVARLEFLTADTGPCDICEEMNGEEFELNDLEKTPPLHPNCRCEAIPILTEQE
jgi:SPP1 gp7 family putative phage head morphogenesis protein